MSTVICVVGEVSWECLMYIVSQDRKKEWTVRDETGCTAIAKDLEGHGNKFKLYSIRNVKPLNFLM